MIYSHRCWVVSVTALALCLELPTVASAIVFPQVDTFQTGTQLWTNESGSNAVSYVASGGPNGSGDGFLQIATDHSATVPGGLFALNANQWAGNYNSAGVAGIAMDLKYIAVDDPANDIEPIRIAILNPLSFTGYSSTAGVSGGAFTLPNDGQWHHWVFSLTTSSLTAIGAPPPLATELVNVPEIHILSSESPDFFGDTLNAQIGIDNVTAVGLVKGDLNRDGHVDIADVQAMMNALTDESGYKSFWGITNDDLITLGDFNTDNAVTNTDLQGLLNYLANGNGSGSLSAVPEPATWALAAIGALLLPTYRVRNGRNRQQTSTSTPKGRFGAITFLAIVLLSALPASAATVWDEGVNGDLSNDYSNPTRLTLATGANSVIGTVSNEALPQDLDYFRIDIPAGRKFTALILQSYVSIDQTAFIAMQSGPNFTFPAGEAFDHIDEILGYTHFGPGSGDTPPPGVDLLPRMGVIGPIGFVPPLSGPTYTFWVQQLGSTTAYQFDLMISPLVKGDFNLNGSVDVGDIQAMMGALSDISKFSADNSVTSTDLDTLGDFTGDHIATNEDLQGLLNLLANGGGTGSTSAVPEPAAWILCAIFAPALLLVRHSRNARNRAMADSMLKQATKLVQV